MTMYTSEEERESSSVTVDTGVDEKRRMVEGSAEPGEAAPLLGGGSPTAASFAGALAAKEAVGGRLPQTIGHRGFRAAYPENTMEAFRAALEVGAHALETDLHLSRDGVVVLSHDPSLARCFGQKEKIADCDWEYLSTLRTTKEPHAAMPRLLDLLTYLAEPGMEKYWVLLDIKRDDDPEELVRRMAEAIAAAPASPSRPWSDRLILGCWDAVFMKHCREYLPGYPLAYIGWSLSYARKLLRHEGIHFNLMQRVLVGPCGARFIRQARAKGRRVFVWTVNDEEWMEWSIRRQVDGVITDDPGHFLDVCRRHRLGQRGGSGSGSGGAWAGSVPRRTVKRWARLYLDVVLAHFLVMFFSVVFRFKYGSERWRIQKALRG